MKFVNLIEKWERTWQNYDRTMTVLGFQPCSNTIQHPSMSGRKRHAQLRRRCLQILGVKTSDCVVSCCVCYVCFVDMSGILSAAPQPETIWNLASWRINPCLSWCEKLLARLLRAGRVRGRVLCWRMLRRLAKQDHASTLRHPLREHHHMGIPRMTMMRNHGIFGVTYMDYTVYNVYMHIYIYIYTHIDIDDVIFQVEFCNLSSCHCPKRHFRSVLDLNFMLDS